MTTLNPMRLQELQSAAEAAAQEMLLARDAHITAQEKAQLAIRAAADARDRACAPLIATYRAAKDAALTSAQPAADTYAAARKRYEKAVGARNGAQEALEQPK